MDLTEINSGDAVHVLVGGPGEPAIHQAPAPQAEQMMGIDALDEPGHVLGKVLQRPRCARTAAAGWAYDRGFIEELPRQDGRIVAVAGHHLRDPVAIALGHAAIAEAGVAGAIPSFRPADRRRAFAIAELVAKGRDHAFVMCPRRRERRVEGAPVSLPVARSERLEEPGAKDVLGRSDGGKGLIERRRGAKLIPALPLI